MSRDCVFCRIIAGEQFGAFVYESNRVVAFLDINQSAVGHTLIVPRAHVAFWWELSDEDAAAVAVASKPVVNALRDVFDPAGLLIEQRNGRAAGQEVFHVHLHVIPKGGETGLRFADHVILNQRAARIKAALRPRTTSYLC